MSCLTNSISPYNIAYSNLMQETYVDAADNSWTIFFAQYLLLYILVLCDNLDNAIYHDIYRVIVIKIINFLLSIIQDNSKFP